MDPTDIGVFQLASRRLDWLDRRQSLLAQNVANANTPGWRMRDLSRFTASNEPIMSTTSPGHLAGRSLAGSSITTAKPQEVSPDGNGVSIEDQLSRVADTAGEQELALNLVRRWGGMLRTAYGRG